MTIKKILIFGMPRTATTQLQIQLSKYYRLENLIEPFTNPLRGFNPVDNNYNKLGLDPYVWTSQQSNCSIKLLGVNLFYIDALKLIHAGNFDLIVLTKRRNLTDCCVSLFVAEQLKKYHHTTMPAITSFECNKDFVLEWTKTYNKFVNSCKQLDENSIEYSTVYYEDYISDQPQNIKGTIFNITNSYVIPYINTAIPYKDLCTNYNEVENIINTRIHG